MYAPIVIFAFNRPEALRRMIVSLKNNPGAEHHEVFVFVDGPRNEADRPKVEEVAAVAHELTDNVTVSPQNKGLGSSIINGVGKIINCYGKAIVLEDDLILMPGFLAYINEALELYASDSRIFSICGYGLKINRPAKCSADVYLCNRSSSWGWATWADRWNSVDWIVADWVQLKSSRQRQKAFNQGGSDMFGMLKGYMEGRNKSWAIRFCYSQHKQGKFSVHPFRSLVANEGYGLDATNCRQKFSRFKIDPSYDMERLVMPEHLELDEAVIKQSVRYHSLPIRIYSKIRGILNV